MRRFMQLLIVFPFLLAVTYGQDQGRLQQIKRRMADLDQQTKAVQELTGMAMNPDILWLPLPESLRHEIDIQFLYGSRTEEERLLTDKVILGDLSKEDAVKQMRKLIERSNSAREALRVEFANKQRDIELEMGRLKEEAAAIHNSNSVNASNISGTWYLKPEGTFTIQGGASISWTLEIPSRSIKHRGSGTYSHGVFDGEFVDEKNPLGIHQGRYLHWQVSDDGQKVCGNVTWWPKGGSEADHGGGSDCYYRSRSSQTGANSIADSTNTASVRMGELEPDTARMWQDLNDAWKEHGATNAEACRDRCLRDSKCTSFSWVKQGVQGDEPRCWIKGGQPPSKTPNSCCISGVKLPIGSR